MKTAMPLTPDGVKVNKNAFQAFAQPNAPEGKMPVPEPLGPCPHPIRKRWVAEALDVEGCGRCGQALDERGNWVHNDEWKIAARAAGVLAP